MSGYSEHLDALETALRKRGHYASDGAGGSDGTMRPQTFVPDVLCKQAADAIENLRAELLSVHRCWDEDCAELFEIRRQRRSERSEASS